MKQKMLYLFTVSFILILVLLLQFYKVEPFESFSLRFNDINFSLQKKEPSKNIVFVGVDERSVNEFGRWPWKRKIIAKGVDQLVQADIVLLDMIFSEETSADQDTVLANSISNLNASVCGFFLRNTSTQEIGDEELSVLSNSSLDLLQSQVVEHANPRFISAPYAEMNIFEIMNACSLSGSFSTLSESDHLFRSYPAAVYYQNILYPSLAIQGLRLKYDKDLTRLSTDELQLGSYKIPLSKNGFVRLNYYDKEKYNIVSFLDLVNQKIKPEYFKDKIVLLGITEIGSGDVVSTPIGRLYGPLLHYTFLSNVLENHLIYEPYIFSKLLIVIMVLVPLFLIFLVRKIFYRAILYTSSYLVIYIFIRYLFVSEMIYIDLFYPSLAMLLSAIVFEVLVFNIQERSSRFIKDAFSSYLSQELLKELVKNPQKLTLGGESKELSVLFSDIRNFTSLSESMNPVGLITLLNRYFTPMTQTVFKHKGMLDKYIGDALMAFFNAPVDVKNHADAACFAALEMIERLEKLNKTLSKEGIPNLSIGIGINTADVVVGNMGSDNRFNYTVIGDGVNLASRVEGLTKVYGVNILITEFTVAKLTESFLYRKIESVKVKGKNEAVLLYELMPLSEKSKALAKLYEDALNLYIDGDMRNSKKIFSLLVDKYSDKPSAYFCKKIENNHTWSVQKMTIK